MSRNSIGYVLWLVTSVWLTAFDARAVEAPQWVEQGPAPAIIPDAYVEAAGCVHVLAAHPTDFNTLYAGTCYGGVWRTSNALASRPSWTPLTDHVTLSAATGDVSPGLTIGALAFGRADPSHRTLYAGTSWGSVRNVHDTASEWPSASGYAGPRRGLLKTTDGGDSWTEVGASTFSGQDVLELLPTGVTTGCSGSETGEVVLAVVAGQRWGVYRSEDGGHGWAPLDLGGLVQVSGHLGQDPAEPRRLYASVHSGVYRSEDAGCTWSRLGALDALVPPGTGFDAFDIALGRAGLPASAASHLFLAPWGQPLVLLSRDNGSSFMSAGFPDPARFFGAELTVDVASAGTIYLMDNHNEHWRGIVGVSSAAWSSMDRGGTYPHTDGHDWVPSTLASVLFEADDGGVYRLQNPASGPFWESANGNMGVIPFVSTAYDHVTHTVFGASSDNALPHQTTLGDKRWGTNEEAGFLADGFRVGVGYLSAGESIHYGSEQRLYGHYRRTYDAANQETGPVTAWGPPGGGNCPIATGGPLILGANVIYNCFEGALGGPGPLGTVRWSQGWAVNAVDANRVMLGTDYLYESTDRAISFQPLGGVGHHPASGDPIPCNPVGTVTSYAYGHPLNPDALYVGTEGLAYAIPGGCGGPGFQSLTLVGTARLWIRQSGTGSPVPATAYAAAGGAVPFGIAMSPSDWRRAYVVDWNARVWTTPDAGATWSDVTGDLGAGVGTLDTLAVVDDLGTDVVLVGGLGVFARRNPTAAGSWTRYGTNLPTVMVTSLTYDRTDDILVAGTLGRGAWTVSPVSATLRTVPQVRFDLGPVLRCPETLGRAVVAGTTLKATEVNHQAVSVSYRSYPGRIPSGAFTTVAGAEAAFTVSGATEQAYTLEAYATNATESGPTSRTEITLVSREFAIKNCTPLAGLRYLANRIPPFLPVPPEVVRAPFVRIVDRVDARLQSAAAVLHLAVRARAAGRAVAADPVLRSDRLLASGVRGMLQFERKAELRARRGLISPETRDLLVDGARPVAENIAALVSSPCPVCGRVEPQACGNGTCDPPQETCASCPADCGVCPVCRCDEELREACETCRDDCGPCCKVCACGDGECEEEETCTTCPSDCGACDAPVTTTTSTTSTTATTIPSACGDSFPACNGTCPPGEDCVTFSEFCSCEVLIP